MTWLQCIILPKRWGVLISLVHFFFLQCHWSELNMQLNSTHKAVLQFLSTSHSLWSPQCTSVFCHRHEALIPSCSHWTGSFHDCFIWILCQVWNRAECPAAVQHQRDKSGQIPWVASSWVNNLLLITHFGLFRMWTHLGDLECEIFEFYNPLSSTLEPLIESVILMDTKGIIISCWGISSMALVSVVNALVSVVNVFE